MLGFFKRRRIVVMLFIFLILTTVNLIPTVAKSYSINFTKTTESNGDGIVTRWALLIGANATYTDNNVNGLLDVLINGGWDENNIFTLIHAENDEVTRDNIFNRLDTIRSLEDSDDIVVFYYTGHGKRDGEMLLDLEDEIILKAEEIRDSFLSFDSENLVFIFDSCYSGSMIPIFSSSFSTKSCAVFASTYDTKWAKTYPSLEKGVFTHFLIQSLEKKLLDEDKNSWISIEETFEYVKTKTKDFTDWKTGYTSNFQTPKYYDSSEDNDIDITDNGMKKTKTKSFCFNRLKTFRNLLKIIFCI